MNKKILLETKDLRQYFPLEKKQDERLKLNRIKQELLYLYTDKTGKPCNISELEKLYKKNINNSAILPQALPLLEEYTTARSQHGSKLFVKANDGIDITLYEGETLGVVGESGCGKSTLGRTLLRLYKATSGKIFYRGQEIGSLKNRDMNRLRPKMQIIFQDPYSSLDPRMTVGQIIGEALIEHKFHTRGSQKLEDYILQTMKICGLDDYMIHRYPHEFSGGQRQRIGIARALALKPEFIVCDEAVSALDVSIQAQIINLLMDLQKEFGLSYLFISHDLSVVKHISDRIAVMYLGKIVEMAPRKRLYESPQHPYTQALLSAIPVTDLDYNRMRKRILLQGDLPSNVTPPAGCKFHTRCPIARDTCRIKDPEWEQVDTDHFVSCHFKGEMGLNNET